MVVVWYLIFRDGPCILGGRQLHTAIMLKANKVGEGWEASWSVAPQGSEDWIRLPAEQPDSLVASGMSLGPCFA